MTLRDYQQQGIDQIAKLYSNGTRRIVFQLPTGGGKTVCFSGMTERYLKAFPNKKVMICVHRDELLRQTRKTLHNHFNLHFEAITADTKHITSNTKGYVAMVETLYNRMKKNPFIAKSIGLLIVDECHIGNFKKIYDLFLDSLIVGFSATPKSSSKKDPLLNYFDEIVTGPQITELINGKSLSQNETYSIKNINRKSLKKRGNDFDEREMGNEYSKSKHVYNVVEAYRKLGDGHKSIVFNCNVDHSKLVNQAFTEAGFDSKHLDGSETPSKRKDIFSWFKECDGAILNNIGVATTGFDEPTIRNVIVNRSTMSMPLWLQMTGRGSRTSQGKDYFRIIDMGGNAITHGDWSSDRNWSDIFHFPDKPSEGGGVAPIKECENCEAIIPAQSTICKFCGHVHERIVEYDSMIPEFELFVGRIDVNNIVDKVSSSNQKKWKVFFEIRDKVVTMLKYRGGNLSEDGVEKAYLIFESKVKEWKHGIGEPFSRSDKAFAKKMFLESVNKFTNKII